MNVVYSSVYDTYNYLWPVCAHKQIHPGFVALLTILASVIAAQLLFQSGEEEVIPVV